VVFDVRHLELHTSAQSLRREVAEELLASLLPEPHPVFNIDPTKLRDVISGVIERGLGMATSNIR
jgi:hypothetical protein